MIARRTVPGRSATGDTRVAILIAGLMAISAVAWLVTRQLSTIGMRTGALTHSSMASMGMSSAMAVGPFLTSWSVMMVAMMLPAVTPVLVTLARRSQARPWPQAEILLFAAGYLLVWFAAGLVAYAFLLALQFWIPSSTTSALRIGGILLAVAGIYQLTPRKDACLRRCRSSLRYLGRYAAPLRGGVAHGLDCLECCWSLMLVLLLLGMMSLAWMAIIGGIILAEKIVPRGERVARLVGFALAGLAITLLVVPHPLPALG